jgi:hypothetical protein
LGLPKTTGLSIQGLALLRSRIGFDQLLRDAAAPLLWAPGAKLGFYD